MNIIKSAKNVIKTALTSIAGFMNHAKKEIETAAKLKEIKGIKGGYTPESLKKFHDIATDLIDFYMGVPIETIKICISCGNRKIGRVMNVSLLPVFTCLSNCGLCKFWCYDIKACLQYINVITARARNTVLLWRDRNRYFDLIDQKMTRRRKNKYFRWHVSGDIIDEDYFDRMVQNARKHPDFIIWTYTKQYKIVNSWCDKNGGKDAIPKNLSVMFSEWKGIKIVNPYGFPEFRVYDDISEVKEDSIICQGNCEACINAKTGCPYGRTSSVKRH